MRSVAASPVSFEDSGDIIHINILTFEMVEHTNGAKW